MKLKECCAHPLLAFVIFLVVSIIAILTTFIILRMKDKPPHRLPLEPPKASTNSPESRKSQNQTIENHLPVSRPPTSSDPSIVTCESPECVTLAHKLLSFKLFRSFCNELFQLNYRDLSIDPCEDFHKASCGRYYENSLAENSIQEKQVFLQRIIKGDVILQYWENFGHFQ
ncbi:hypothetical protein CRE_06588 [Caenorhabditis remanei]|uniref:Uncharacterized protein n=1 Tax=Caenorhabditis remanei TaxID=31234 RepID=E3M1N8_CAERE|nr:hypothetical protein CRE_06588 [Caenorhabditis remanei]